MLACSGPGAAEAIANAERLGLITWALTLALAIAFVVSKRLRPRKIRWVMLALAIAHPGLWLSARSGDCGALLQLAAVATSVLLAAVMAGVFLKARTVESARG